MTGKITEPKIFDPFAQATADAVDDGIFGTGRVNMARLTAICRNRGLIGNWTQQALSAPLTSFEQASRDKNADEIEALLNSFATTIGFDANLTKRHFYAIRQGWEKQFLSDLDKERADDDKFIDTALAEP